MFLIRQATVDDAATLLKLAKMVHFINLPADPDVINTKIARSRRSFDGRAQSPRERQFMFVLEDTGTGNIIGTSSIISCVSWPGHPHTYLQVRRRELYSEDLQAGHVHVTLQFGTDETGPTEIGGLILGPSYRGHPQKLGAQLSLVRFHFMGLHREWFAERVIAEMMGALTPDSRNLLWEYLGRRFINLDYSEADRFSQASKEFITSLFPREEIYVCLLPAVARKLIGHVGPETAPARRMLERLGFQYKGHIDPFDGGPYLEAQLDEIPAVRSVRLLTLGPPAAHHEQRGIVSNEETDTGFRGVLSEISVQGESVSMPAAAAELIGAEIGMRVGVTPMPGEPSEGTPRSRAAAPAP